MQQWYRYFRRYDGDAPRSEHEIFRAQSDEHARKLIASKDAEFAKRHPESKIFGRKLERGVWNKERDVFLPETTVFDVMDRKLIASEESNQDAITKSPL